MKFVYGVLIVISSMFFVKRTMTVDNGKRNHPWIKTIVFCFFVNPFIKSPSVPQIASFGRKVSGKPLRDFRRAVKALTGSNVKGKHK